MEPKELNRHIKNMAKRIKEGKLDPHSKEAHELFLTIHMADNTYRSQTADSLRIMIVLNRKFHYIHVKDFGPTEL